MAVRARSLLVVAAGAVLVGLLPTAGCSSVLGDFEIQALDNPSEAGASQQDGAVDQTGYDAGGSTTEDASPTPENDAGGQQPQSDAGVVDSGVTTVCDTANDCAPLDTTPAGCAIPHCNANKCEYHPIDKDGDGHPSSSCKNNSDGTMIAGGDDCNDEDPTIYPGGSCAYSESGTKITFPTPTPVGLCKTGTWDCSTNSAVCKGAVAPAAAEDCTAKNDANCNGIPDDGCVVSACTNGTTQPCGNPGNKPAPCKTGTQTCTGGAWGTCVGNVDAKARDCTSAVDNDCSGTIDQNEAICHCTGSVPIGQNATCTVPAQKGQCAVGSAKCQASADKTSAVLGTCTGPGPQVRDCASTLDNDCNGISDELDVGCGSPCLDGGGNPMAAMQKFASNIWGCQGVRSFAARTAACAGGSFVCPQATWTTYIRGGGKAPIRQYWVSENLNYGGSPPIYGGAGCFASTSTGTPCTAGYSMHVCVLGASGGPTTDPDGNQCNWTGCTSGTAAGPNDYMGGCNSGPNAGTLCCK